MMASIFTVSSASAYMRSRSITASTVRPSTSTSVSKNPDGCGSSAMQAMGMPGLCAGGAGAGVSGAHEESEPA